MNSPLEANDLHAGYGRVPVIRGTPCVWNLPASPFCSARMVPARPRYY